MQLKENFPKLVMRELREKDNLVVASQHLLLFLFVFTDVIQVTFK
jgi:hypothetical protein